VQNRNPGSSPPAGECPGKGPGRSVNPGANMEAVSQHQPPDSQSRVPQPKTTHLIPQFCLTEKKLDKPTPRSEKHGVLGLEGQGHVWT
jgi:hypothetical protein